MRKSNGILRGGKPQRDAGSPGSITTHKTEGNESKPQIPQVQEEDLENLFLPPPSKRLGGIRGQNADLSVEEMVFWFPRQQSKAAVGSGLEIENDISTGSLQKDG
ncbi:hypothetical protein CEXT_519211 [Caerostris extrusa]|uniref:Uncharacterized protein n=1 Tax=Caerostris extrusa TaxID=172846 RepID=A0AAV4RIC9_CAEEX|nr:hypothetical protein CEXT_519211 [Caerostris extrusa]